MRMRHPLRRHVVHAAGAGVRDNACASSRLASFVAALLVAFAGFTGVVRADDALDARLKHLETTLRCLVCQNQTLAESDAPLAADLRREIRELAVKGSSDEDIRGFLVARYGDFVLYDPPFKRVTLLLWLGPFALLLLGAVVWWQVLRRRSRPDAVAPTEAARARARAIIDEI
jgi:cytochrome c-type biogenesis protein CcmH